MFSGAKNKLQQWRQRRNTSRFMENIRKENFREKCLKVNVQLQTLHSECHLVIQRLNQQVQALSAIGEETTSVNDKICLLEKHVNAIEQGLQKTQEFTTFLEFVEMVNNEVNRTTSDIENLNRKASSLCSENRKLRTELQIFQDHHERAEIRAVELEIQNQHLKYISTLPSDINTFFENDEKSDVKEEDEKPSLKPDFPIPFFEDEDLINCAGSELSNMLDTIDFSSNSRLKILFDLIKDYVKDGAYDIAIPLLKTTLEDLLSKHEPYEKVVFSIMVIMSIIYNMTQRFKDALEIEKEILGARRIAMLEDEIGLSKTLSRVAVLYAKTGKVKAARIFCREALDLKNKIHGEGDLETAKELHNMGVLYFYDRKYTKAIECLQSSINIIRSGNKKNIFCLGRSAANMGSVLIQKEDLQEAKRVLSSNLKFLHKELDNMLEGTTVLRDQILTNASEFEKIPDPKHKIEIKKLVSLTKEVTEILENLPDVKMLEPKNGIENSKHLKVVEEE